MKKTVLIVLVFMLLLTGMAAGQGLPDIGGNNAGVSAGLPDPGQFLGSAGRTLERNYRYNGDLYDTYLYDPPEKESAFVTAYYMAAVQEGFEPELGFVEQYPTLSIYDPGGTGNPALLMYDYQGYVLLMVPVNMEFSLGSKTGSAKPSVPAAPTATPIPTATQAPTATPVPARTPTRTPVPTATKTPRPTATRDPNAGYEKYRVTGAGIYGFQIRPYANTDWFFKEQYQHPVYNGDVVYFTGSIETGPGYDQGNIKWMSVKTPDGFTGWLPAYILTKAR